MNIINWQTELSSVSDLYFEDLADNGALIAHFSDENSIIYDIICKDKLAYKVSDEKLLQEYWVKKDNGIGWSFQITRSNWISEEIRKDYPSILHFVISSWDLCLEIMATNVEIRQRAK